MKFVSNLFSKDIEFYKPKVFQALKVNFNLYLLILLRGAWVSNNILILFKYIWLELSPFCLSILNNLSQSKENSQE